MQRGDGRLDLVRPGAAPADGPLHDPGSFVDLLPVPPAPVLILEEHQLASSRDPGVPPGVLEQHQREQAEGLGLVGHQQSQDPAEPDGLGAQLPADQGVAGGGRVALVEHQVQDGQHGLEPLGEHVARRDPVRDVRVPDLPLGPDQPLGHGRLGDQEGPGDLGGGQPSQGAERQGDPGVDGQRGVAAREDQPQPVVLDGAFVHRVPQGLKGRQPTEDLRLLGQPSLPAESIDGPVPSGGGDPGPRAVGDPIAGPPFQRHHEGLLDGLLGQVEVAEHPDERRHRPSGLLAEQAGGDAPGVRFGYASGGRSITGRMSTTPVVAAGILAAHVIASS